MASTLSRITRRSCKSRFRTARCGPSSSSSSTSSSCLLRGPSAPVPFLLLVWTILLCFSRHDSAAAGVAASISFSSSSDNEDDAAEMQAAGGKGGGDNGGGGLCWQDLIITTSPAGVVSDNNDSNTIIVHECSGYIPNGQVCGILGPSGSGKTSFMAALTAPGGSSRDGAGATQQRTAATTARCISTGSSSSLYVHGNVFLYHPQKSDDAATSAHCSASSISTHDVAWLQQEDEFFAMLTVQETLSLAAFLELPHLSLRQRQERVQEQLATLGLTHVAHRRVGSTNVRSNHGGGGGAGGVHTADAALGKNLEMDSSNDLHTTATTGATTRSTGAGSRRASGGGGGRLSGGERRRLSVALELLTHDKKLLLADESTSGLDSRMARQVMILLQRMARLNHIPAICSLHQPQSYIYWNLLDQVLLMAPGGHVVYAGPRQDCLDYFAHHTKATTDGPHVCPQGTNPAEFLVDLVSIDTEDAEQAQRDLQRIQELALCFAEYQKEEERKHPSPCFTIQAKQQSTRRSDSHEQSDARISRKQRRQRLATLPRIRPLLGHLGRLSRRWLALLRRSWRQNIRNGKANLFRFATSAGTAILLSMVFFPTVGGGVATAPASTSGLMPTANSVADRVALLTFGAVNMFFMAFLKTITLISEEQPVVQREQTRQQYSSLEYLLAKVVAELPLDTLFATVFTTVLKLCSGVRISWRLLTATFSLLTISGASLGFMLGSWFQELSMPSSSPVVVVLMVVGVINPGGVDAKSPPPPALIRWLKRCSPFVYAVEALCLGEYPGMQLRGPRYGLWGRLKDLPRMGAFAMVQNGDQVIEALGLKGKTYQGVMETLGKLSIYYLALSWVGLQVMGHHSQWTLNRSAESSHPKVNDGASNSRTTTPTNEDMLRPTKGSLREMSAIKVPPKGW